MLCRLKPGYLRAHRCHQVPPGRGQADRIRARAAPAPADGPTPGVDDASSRATGPAPSPRPCASAGSARGDRACHAARTVRSWPPRAGRESDSPGSTPPHARCHSYGTGRRRLSLGSRPRKWPACAGNEKLRTFSTAATCRCCSCCQGPEQHPNSTPRRSRSQGKPTQIINLRRRTSHVRSDHMPPAAQAGYLTLLRPAAAPATTATPTACALADPAPVTGRLPCLTATRALAEHPHLRLRHRASASCRGRPERRRGERTPRLPTSLIVS